jgi:hypothetical protein
MEANLDAGNKKGPIDELLKFSCTKIHCKKSLTIFPSRAGISLTKLSLAGKNLIIPRLGEFGQ